MGTTILKTSFARTLRDYAMVTVGILLYVLGWSIFLVSNNLVGGGVTGLSAILQYATHGVIKIGYSYFVINVALIIAAVFVLGFGFGWKTIYATVLASVGLNVFQAIIPADFIQAIAIDNGKLMSTIMGGIMVGVGIGLTMVAGGSTGGTDVLAAFVHKRRPEQSVVWIIFMLNTLVALSSFFVYDYRYEPVILCIIYCFLSSRISDQIIRGGKKQLKFEIITHHADEMGQEIIQTLHHSATVMPARGMYSGHPTEMLVCVINKHQIIEMQQIISHYPGSFAYVGDVDEVFGNYRAWHEIEQREREGLYQ